MRHPATAGGSVEMTTCSHTTSDEVPYLGGIPYPGLKPAATHIEPSGIPSEVPSSEVYTDYFFSLWGTSQ